MHFSKNINWVAALFLSLLISCGRPDGAHINDDPNDFVQPDSVVPSDSLIPGQPNGYAPAGTNDSLNSNNGADNVDSATKGKFQ